MLSRLQASNPVPSLLAVSALGLCHVAVLAFIPNPQVLSNVVQICAALLALGFSLSYAWRTKDRFLRYAWLQLGAAFALWSSAQCLYFITLITKQKAPPFPSTASILYFLVAFPILLVTAVRRTETKWDWVNWLDSAQACIFFFVLDGLLFSRPSLVPVTVAYDVQSLALVLTGALRYSSSTSEPERIFFRNLFAFLSAYGLLLCVGIHLEVDSHIATHWLDLCWSAPFLFFCGLFTLSRQKAEPARAAAKAASPSHLHGLGALGLAVLAIAAAGVLELHRLVAGAAALGCAFLLFAVRTSTREFQLHKAHGTLQHTVLHDALTGLANRTHLHRELITRLQDDPDAASLSLLFIDLDRFKTINDGLGHAFGDKLLIAIARILRSAVQPGDLVARLGGDEFVVLAQCGSQAEAQTLANAIVNRLHQPLELEDRVLHITASVGIIVGEPGSDPDELLRNADCAMYVAKHRGKDQAAVFEASMGEKANKTLRLETDLREAVACGGISVFYQPIYSLADKAVIGFEALARWQHHTSGFVSPAEFIPIAEDCGLISELGRQMLREACRQVREWNSAFQRDFYISVNVSARQFADEHLLENITSALTDAALPANRLKIEVTESVLLNGTQPVERILNAVRAMGIEVALDDFGTGYSSLSYLLRFPFDVIKIDRSFVQALDQNVQRADLASAIVQIAANLGKQVIAEGVETENELRCLQRMQCDLLQGYLFSKPITADAVSRLLAEGQDILQPFQEHRKPIWAAPPATGPLYTSMVRDARTALLRPSLVDAASMPLT